MSFEAELLEALGGAEDVFDIRASVRRCFFFDFEGSPTRLWMGQGILHAGGHDWIGVVDAEGNPHISVPAVRDTRDGSSPRYNFSMPNLDDATVAELKADKSKVEGRSITCYHVIVKEKEGLRPGTALRFAYRLTMQDVTFSNSLEGDPANPRRVRTATVLARSGEVGRSITPNGTYTDTSQRERARLAGFASDSFCTFVAANSSRTLTIEGS